ncbi:MAG: Tar ligand binding domain-containing protein [Burkholderiales bacterium]|nr:Tar ligand binding domain-containing protein [Burkholderiales bacterium]
MNQITIRMRLTLLVASLLALLLISSGSSLWRQRGANELLQSLYNDRVVPMRQLKAVAAARTTVQHESVHWR